MMKYNEDLKNYELMNTIITSLINGKKVIVYNNQCAVSIDGFVRYFLFSKPLRTFKKWLIKNILFLLNEKYSLVNNKKISNYMYILYNEQILYILKIKRLRSMVFELSLEVGKDVDIK